MYTVADPPGDYNRTERVRAKECVSSDWNGNKPFLRLLSLCFHQPGFVIQQPGSTGTTTGFGRSSKACEGFCLFFNRPITGRLSGPDKNVCVFINYPWNASPQLKQGAVYVLYYILWECVCVCVCVCVWEGYCRCPSVCLHGC